MVNLALVLAAFEFVSADQGEGVAIVMSGSTKERLYIIDYVYERIAQNPLVGWGFDGSRAIGQATRSLFSANPSIPLHPHNLWAQTWLELGLIGVVLVISLGVSIFMPLAAGGRGLARADALGQAESRALGAGVELGRVLSVSEAVVDRRFYGGNSWQYYAQAMGISINNDSSTPIMSESFCPVTVQVQVSMSFEIVSEP